ncbi:hypothetical protein BTV20_02445 [Histophilus somni]|uniref:Lipoprotein n=1 Tax=Histophilus somni TaxID=731 RepID=A0A9Q6Z1U5_HISSO|nr:hypothetical protein [Histophilus somni]ARU64443.1 hypothetical protein BTV18_02445 [Histophilus somni]ARU66230.1 hypothetical protein BTV19_02440 [Histophilus somni]ARU68104.1 hypothetical protein BTV16_02445 [Histophilus somni]ARU69985.1 hypothetical protein BTV20_02445 [Histophilus somni]ARU71859.1 hypothetical protein BTV17_02440 [Histophilus somni]
MYNLRYPLFLASALLITGCAELSALNQKVGDWAGEINRTLNADKQQFSDTLTSKRDIDTLYVRIKRNVGFETMEEMLKCDPESNKNCAWKKSAIAEGGYVHEKTPGVYYRMADSFGNEGRYYVAVTLEKEGKNTLISWRVKGSQGFANQIKADILKAAK